MENLPEDAVLLGAMTFFEKETESMETELFVQRLKQHVAINLYSLYTDNDVTTDELKDCIRQLQNLLVDFEQCVDANDVEGVDAILKDVGFGEV